MNASDSAVDTHNPKAPSQAELDAGLERVIETARRAMVNARTRDDAHEFRRIMEMLLKQRSPEQIQRMEERMGLR